MISATASATAGAPQPPANPSAMLGQDDFLKLMIAQLQAQDPLQPANATEYVSELAQFTQVEQITNLAASSERSSAVALIGRQVTYVDPSGALATGVVQSVQSNGTESTLTVEGAAGVKQSSIREVQ